MARKYSSYVGSIRFPYLRTCLGRLRITICLQIKNVSEIRTARSIKRTRDCAVKGDPSAITSVEKSDYIVCTETSYEATK